MHSDEDQIRQLVATWMAATMWTRLNVVATLPDGTPPIERAGHTLSILKKENGQWLLARDANLLAPVQRFPAYGPAGKGSNFPNVFLD